MDNRKSTCLVLFNLSAAFNTLDHATLLNHLQSRFKITGVVLKWIESYLSDRSQAVVLENEEGETAMSNVVRLSMGVPQGSVLGLLFTLFYNTLGEIYVGIMIRISICMLMALNYMHQSLLHLKSLENPVCLKLIHVSLKLVNRCSIHLLKLNEDTPESMFIATHQQLSKFLP